LDVPIHSDLEKVMVLLIQRHYEVTFSSEMPNPIDEYRRRGMCVREKSEAEFASLQILQLSNYSQSKEQMFAV